MRRLANLDSWQILLAPLPDSAGCSPRAFSVFIGSIRAARDETNIPLQSVEQVVWLRLKLST